MNPHTGQMAFRVSAREVFALMVQSAWASGDPGLVFIDRVNQTNPLPHLGLIEATNPCGEQPLLPYESCTLGSVNLARLSAEAGWTNLPWPKRCGWPCGFWTTVST